MEESLIDKMMGCRWWGELECPSLNMMKSSKMPIKPQGMKIEYMNDHFREDAKFCEKCVKYEKMDVLG